MTLEICARTCRNYLLFGVENGYECFCGNNLSPGGNTLPLTSCNVPCNGDVTETCGAEAVVSLYQKRIGAGGPLGGPPGSATTGAAASPTGGSSYTDSSTDNSAFLSPTLTDDSRTDSPNTANNIANGDHKLTSGSTTTNTQHNGQGQSVSVNV